METQRERSMVELSVRVMRRRECAPMLETIRENITIREWRHTLVLVKNTNVLPRMTSRRASLGAAVSSVWFVSLERGRKLIKRNQAIFKNDVSQD